MNMVNVFSIVGAVALAVIVFAIAVFVVGAILTAWEYAKSPRAQMTKELEDDGSIDANRMTLGT